VQLDDIQLQGNGNNNDSCQVDVELTWLAGASGTWSTNIQAGPVTTSNNDRTVGSQNDLSVWGAHPWTLADLTDGRFQVRLTWREGTPSCPNSRSVRLDQLDVRVIYDFDDVTTITRIEEVDVVAPDDTVLDPQNFWGSLQSQGAPNIQGDAYMTYYDTRTVATNAAYNDEGFYQYGIEFPPGSSGGEVWVFDPGFCNVDSDKGTGEYYTSAAPTARRASTR
jgi:hypothetical protein